MSTESSLIRNAAFHLDYSECFTYDKSNVALAFILVTGILLILENVLGIVVIRTKQTLQKVDSIFLVSLATTDVIVGVTWVFMPLSEIFIADVSREIHEALQTFCILASVHMSCLSILHIAVIAVERYLYIARPFQHQRYVTATAVKATISMLWILVSIFLLIAEIVTYSNGIRICTARHLPHWLAIFMAGPVYFLCAAIACVAYLKISCIALKQRRTIAVIPQNGCLTPQGHAAGDVLKSVKFFGIVFGVFLIMTWPGIVALLVQHSMDIPKTFFSVLAGMVTFNSCTNFIILTAINANFRSAIKETFFCCLSKKCHTCISP